MKKLLSFQRFTPRADSDLWLSVGAVRAGRNDDDPPVGVALTAGRRGLMVHFEWRVRRVAA